MRTTNTNQGREEVMKKKKMREEEKNYTKKTTYEGREENTNKIHE